MRILHVLQPRVGGAEVVARLLVRAQAERHEVGVVCPPDARLAAAAPALGARLWTLPLGRAVAPADALHLAALVRILDDFGPDVVHAHSSKAGVLGRLAGLARGVPVVLSPHNFAYRAYEGGRAARAAFLAIERVLAPATAFLHASCDDEYRDAVRRGLGAPHRAATIHNAVDLEPFTAVAPPATPARLVGTYARLEPQKGVDVLVDAASRLARRELEIVVTGNGTERTAIEQRVAAWGLNGTVRLVPDPGDAAAVIGALDVYVQPSRTETYPLGLMEAMAAGRAVVATAVGGVPEMVEDGVDGLLVPPERPDELADAIARLLDDDGLRLRLAAAARAKAMRRFDYRRMAARLEVVYESLIR